MPADNFQTTQWSLVLTAKDRSADAAREAFDGLARMYWKPLYAYVRRRGYSVEESEDLAQGFFARFIEKGFLDEVAEDKGRFRAFLLTCIKRYIADEYDKQQAQKRGGGQEKVPIDMVLMESTIVAHLGSVTSPEAAYDRAWAITVLDEALARVAASHKTPGKVELFEALKHRLVGNDDRSYEDLAKETGFSEEALRKKVQRLRSRTREAFRHIIKDSLANEGDADDEIRLLFSALN